MQDIDIYKKLKLENIVPGEFLRNICFLTLKFLHVSYVVSKETEKTTIKHFPGVFGVNLIGKNIKYLQFWMFHQSISPDIMKTVLLQARCWCKVWNSSLYI